MEQRQSLIKNMKHSGIEWIGGIPYNWSLERLQWYLDEIKELNNPIKTEQVLSLTNKLGVVPYEEKGEQGNKAKENLNEYKVAYPNTIVANSMNILIGSVGICNYTGCVSPVYYVFKPNKKCNIRFINFILQTEGYQKELRKYANGILEIRLRVSSNGILKRKIAIPDLDTQNKIVDYIDNEVEKINDLIKNEEDQIQKLKEYKQSLITEVVTKGLDKNVEMKDSGVEYIGKIPKKWNIVKLRYLGTCQNGISKSAEDFGFGYPFVSYGDVYNNYSLPVSVKGLINTNPNERDIYSVKENDVFFTRTSETIEEIGFTSVCLKTIEQAVFAGFLIRFRPNNNCSLLANFSKYYFRSNIHRKFFNKYMNIVTRASLSQGLLKNLPVLIPSINEQRKIINYLDSKCGRIEDLILIKNKKIEKLNEYKKSLIYEYVTGKKEV